MGFFPLSIWHNNKPLTLLSPFRARSSSFGQPINYKCEYFTVNIPRILCYSWYTFFFFIFLRTLISHSLAANLSLAMSTLCQFSWACFKFVLAKKIYFSKLNFRTQRWVLVFRLCSWLESATSQHLELLILLIFFGVVVTATASTAMVQCWYFILFCVWFCFVRRRKIILFFCVRHRVQRKRHYNGTDCISY